MHNLWIMFKNSL